MDFKNNQGITKEEAIELSTLSNEHILELMCRANQVRQSFCGNRVDLCSIVSVRTGGCTEDCLFCAQSRLSSAAIQSHGLLTLEQVRASASSAKEWGASRFCIVTSGRAVLAKEIGKIEEMIAEVKALGLLPCATLGLMDYPWLLRLKEAGLHRYHHNLESAEGFFSRICTTHAYTDKLHTIEAAIQAGLSVCSGGIFGLGESWEDRIEMAFALKSLQVDSIPLNFLTPIHGTPLEIMEPVPPLEALKIIAIYRLILPDRQIRICGGRPGTLRQLNSCIFWAGADGLLIGNYLTTTGKEPSDDMKLIDDLGLIMQHHPVVD
ncbi:MAG TPA: biotin synthase BioB [Thermodesulfovibrionia bacterium]|nr:biotin synthase BioB [Thermodesulfovibrionia bacterium]